MTAGNADALGKSVHGTPSPSLPTPGPWTWDGSVAVHADMSRNGCETCGGPDTSTRGLVALVYARGRGTLPANARLIAAAPELLAALTKAHACGTLRDDGTCDGCFVSEAIAKATERSA